MEAYWSKNMISISAEESASVNFTLGNSITLGFLGESIISGISLSLEECPI